MGVTRPYAGYVGYKKTGGSVTGGLTTNDERRLLCTSATPINPDPNSYMPVINVSSYPSVRALGKKHPAAQLVMCYKPYDSGTGKGWADSKIFNSWIHVDATQQTDKGCLFFKDDQLAIRRYDWSRCSRIMLRQQAEGGPLMVMADFLTRWGESEGPYSTTLPDGEIVGAAPTFSAPGSADPGELTNVAEIGFSGSLNEVTSWQLELIRGQRYEFYLDETSYAKDIATTMFSGLFYCEQSPTASAQIAGGEEGQAIVTIGAIDQPGSIKITMILQRDNRLYPMTPTIGMLANTYSCVDLTNGGNPVTIEPYVT